MQPEVSAERLVGPTFAQNIRRVAENQIVDCPFFAGGMSGIEPELVVCVGRDAPPDKFDWTIDEASVMAGDLHIGAELISSSLSSVTKYGLPSIVVVGKAVPGMSAQ